MNETPERDIVLQWITLAKADLENAENTFRMEMDSTFTTICFHAQQCVEKLAKALLIFHKVDFPKSHDLTELFALIKPHLDLSAELPNPAVLTQYAVTTRYPGTWDSISSEEAEEAVQIAIRMYNEIILYFQQKGIRTNQNH